MAAIASAPSASRKMRHPISLAQDAALVAYAGLAAWAHVLAVSEGRLSSAPFLVEQLLLVGIFLFRRRATAVSRRPLDWIVAGGSWLPILMRPGEPLAGAMEVPGLALQTFGLVLTCIGFLYLGRSFGIVAANRGLKVRGPYRIVRHPIYFAHQTTMIGFLLINWSWLNLAIFAVITCCQLARISAEERVLVDSSEYARYRDVVRWRLIPGVY